MMPRLAVGWLVTFAMIAHGHCNGDVSQPTAPGSPTITKVDVSPSTVAADGTALVLVHVSPLDSASSGAQLVTLTSSTGSFVVANASTITGVASPVGGLDATLKVGRDTGTFTIKAYAGGSTAVTTVRLTPALAQLLQLSAASLTVAPKATIAVTATATRSPGFVSRGTPISFTLARADGGAGLPAGSIDAVSATDSLGVATVHFTSGNTATPDSVWLVAQTASTDSTKPIKSQILLYITP